MLFTDYRHNESLVIALLKGLSGVSEMDTNVHRQSTRCITCALAGNVLHQRCRMCPRCP